MLNAPGADLGGRGRRAADGTAEFFLVWRETQRAWATWEHKEHGITSTSNEVLDPKPLLQ